MMVIMTVQIEKTREDVETVSSNIVSSEIFLYNSNNDKKNYILH